MNTSNNFQNCQEFFKGEIFANLIKLRRYIHVISYLKEIERSVPTIEIATQFKLSYSGARTALKKLEKVGLIEEQKEAEDKTRYYFVSQGVTKEQITAIQRMTLKSTSKRSTNVTLTQDNKLEYQEIEEIQSSSSSSCQDLSSGLIKTNYELLEDPFLENEPEPQVEVSQTSKDESELDKEDTEDTDKILHDFVENLHQLSQHPEILQKLNKFLNK